MPRAQDVTNALSRIRGVMSPKKEAEKATRDIRLGLERIARVLPGVQEWQGVHVGGTNGKGSICAYLSGLFTLAGVSYGRFISPAFPEKYNAVSINGKYVSPRVYETERKSIEAMYQRLSKGWRFKASETPGPLSPFEIETATAFGCFNRMRVEYGIVEVGMGGATDATNAMRRKGVTVISKIGLDHQEYLGNTIEEIAKVKAGIMRPGVPCIVDDSNQSSVINVLRQHASSIGTHISLSWKAEDIMAGFDNTRWQLEEYQLQNLRCATLAFHRLFPNKEIDLDRLLQMQPSLPGRLEWVDISQLTNGLHKAPVLVDAAHNLLGVQGLNEYTEKHVRSDGKPVTWVIGFSASKTKPFATMMETLVRPQDSVAFVEFDQQANEPAPTPAESGRAIVKDIVQDPSQIYNGKPDIQSATNWASSQAKSGHIVLTGSLYLVRDFLRLEGINRPREMGQKTPGLSQLWRYSKLWRQRPLTKGEYQEFEKARLKWEAVRHDTDKGQMASAPANHDNNAETSKPREENVLEAAFYSDRDPPRGTFPEVLALREQLSRQQNQLREAQEALQRAEKNTGSQEVDSLKTRITQHQDEYDQTLEKLLHHPDAPRQYALTYTEIFGRAPTRRLTPFEQRTELDQTAPREQPVEEEVVEEPKREEEVERDFWGRPIGIEEIPEPAAPPKRRV